MSTITVPLPRDLEDFINNEVSSGRGESKAHIVREALVRLREEKALACLHEAEVDIKEGRVFRGDLSKLLKKMS